MGWTVRPDDWTKRKTGAWRTHLLEVAGERLELRHLSNGGWQIAVYFPVVCLPELPDDDAKVVAVTHAIARLREIADRLERAL